MRRGVTAGILILLLAGAASAQWVDVPLPGVPRNRDGKPNLAVATPKIADGKPDLSGVWKNLDAKYLNDLASDGVQVPFTAWGAALYKQRQETNSKGRPSESCLPH